MKLGRLKSTLGLASGLHLICADHSLPGPIMNCMPSISTIPPRNMWLCTAFPIRKSLLYLLLSSDFYPTIVPSYPMVWESSGLMVVESTVTVTWISFAKKYVLNAALLCPTCHSRTRMLSVHGGICCEKYAHHSLIPKYLTNSGRTQSNKQQSFTMLRAIPMVNHHTTACMANILTTASCGHGVVSASTLYHLNIERANYHQQLFQRDTLAWTKKEMVTMCMYQTWIASYLHTISYSMKVGTSMINCVPNVMYLSNLNKTPRMYPLDAQGASILMMMEHILMHIETWNNHSLVHIHNHPLMIRDMEQLVSGTKAIAKIPNACTQKDTTVPALTKKPMGTVFALVKTDLRGVRARQRLCLLPRPLWRMRGRRGLPAGSA